MVLVRRGVCQIRMIGLVPLLVVVFLFCRVLARPTQYLPHFSLPHFLRKYRIQIFEFSRKKLTVASLRLFLMPNLCNFAHITAPMCLHNYLSSRAKWRCPHLARQLRGTHSIPSPQIEHQQALPSWATSGPSRPAPPPSQRRRSTKSLPPSCPST